MQFRAGHIRGNTPMAGRSQGLFLPAIPPGLAAAFYPGDLVMRGGWIARKKRSGVKPV